MDIINYLIIGGSTLFGLLIIGWLMMKMYIKSTNEVAFVRTGLGNPHVIMGGGGIALPGLHEITPVNMKTMKLVVSRGKEDALITKDNFRVDIQSEFFIQISPDAESIKNAARTLGRSTLQPDELSKLFEAKFVDALRSISAIKNMKELHEERQEFVQSVQNTLKDDLIQNGITLSAVSLTHLDQTDKSYFNPDNSFDSQGLILLTEITENSAKQRNEIQANARVAIETKNLEAEKKSLELSRESEFARLSQQQEIEKTRAIQNAEIMKEQALRKQEAESVQILADKKIAEENVAKEMAVKVKKVESDKLVQLSEQEARIEVSNKSKAESEAKTLEEIARAESVKASEQVKTVEATEIAERNKQIRIIEAKAKAEEESTQLIVMSEAEFKSAENQAQAKERLLQADEKAYEVESEGKRKLNEAENLISQEIIDYRIRETLINNLPSIVEQMMKPVEKIDSIKIIQSPTGINNGSVSSNNNSGGMANDLTNALLQYKLNSPLIDQITETLGVNINSPEELIQSASGITKKDFVTVDQVIESQKGGKK